MGLAEGYMVKYHGSHAGKTDGDKRVHSLEDPLPTLDTSNRMAVADPFVVRFYGNSDAQGIQTPLATITTRDRFALVSPELVRSGQIDGEVIGYLDIRFRMLQPHELGGAMGLEKDYLLCGNREDKVKQIGNMVSVEVAEAVGGEAMERRGFSIITDKGGALAVDTI